MWEGVGDRIELKHIDPHSYGHNSVSFPFSWAAQPGAWGPGHSGTCSSFQHLLSNWLNFLCTELYNSSTSTFFLWASQITLIQPVHGQGYILIFLDRMHLLFTQVHFLFWLPGWVGGQYTTLPQVSPVYLGIEMIQPGEIIFKVEKKKLISQVESFQCPDQQGTPEEGW